MKHFAPLLAAVAISACATVPTTGPASDLVTVSGEATYRERIALAPGSQMVVRIEETSRADAAATTLAEQTYLLERRQVPIAFSVPVPRTALTGAVRTTARVQILGPQGDLAFTTDTAHPVVVRPGQESVELGTLVMVRAGN